MSDIAGPTVRVSHGSGKWFPKEPKELRALVDSCMGEANVPCILGDIVGAIAPHAGFQYSGPVAGHTFRAIQKNADHSGAPDLAVVIGFSHRSEFHGIALMDGDGLETPLGIATLDKEAARQLSQGNRLIEMNYTPHIDEHSAENQIPFMQATIPRAKYVVALVGDKRGDTVDSLVDGLLGLSATRKVLVVASTDMLHDPSHELVSATDRDTLVQMETMDEIGLMERWSPAFQVCCGISPVATMMRYSRAMGCNRGHILHYRNSGDDFPESRGQWVVGYASAVFSTETKAA
jgi:AmmeMemoRadiSam system protein B